MATKLLPLLAFVVQVSHSLARLCRIFTIIQAVGSKDSNSKVVATSWGAPRVDVFGVAPDNTIFHKYETGYGWAPRSGFENMGGNAVGAPSVVSWGQNRLDYFYVGNDSEAKHKYWDGSQWV